jgi:hypothetical protein
MDDRRGQRPERVQAEQTGTAEHPGAQPGALPWW